jgi:putative ABC transport system permease protein
MQLLFLALRNLTRNKRRTLITGLGIMFGVMAIIALQGFAAGFTNNQIDATVQSKLGAVQVFRKGYLGSDDPLKVSLTADAQLMARILAVSGVTAVAPRIDFDGMISNGSESTLFMATAIDPQLEYQVCPKRQTRVSPGSEPLRAGGGGGDALIGKTLAESLGAKKGSTLVMQAAGPHASTNALDVEVSGFLPSHNIAESKRLATVHISYAQELLRMKGLITEYVVGVRELEQAPAVAARLQAALGDRYEVTTWDALDPATKTRATSLNYVLLFVALVLFLLVATGIINTMLMSVYERVREIGTMLALGVRRWQVTSLFLWEATALGLFSAVVGAGLGYGMIRWVARSGVTVKPPGGDATTIYPHVEPSFVVLVILFAGVGTILSGLYPAWKAARLRPVDALRAN